MKGLIKKDLLMIKNNLKIVIIIFFVFFIMALQGEVDISFAPSLISVMLFMSTFSYDEYNKWDAYVITLPNGRKNVVKAKYIATFILIVVSILLNMVVGVINNNVDYEKIFSLMAGCCFGVGLVQAIVYPLIFKYGIEKGRIGLFIGVFVMASVIGLLSKVIDIDISSNILVFIENYWLIFIPIVLIITLFISYKISLKIYLKKEF